jgi:hypothetical protein
MLKVDQASGVVLENILNIWNFLHFFSKTGFLKEATDGSTST